MNQNQMIEYRAWIIGQKRMAEVLTLGCLRGLIPYAEVTVKEGVTSFLELGHIELMPFIGLMAKGTSGAAQKLFVGDIFTDARGRFYKVFEVKGGYAFNQHPDDFYKDPAEISFYESCGDMQNASFIEGGATIVGNIYENPELLKKKADKSE